MKKFFKVEKNVPLPAGRYNKKYYYPYEMMEVGDSFFIKNEDYKGSPQRIQCEIINSARRYVLKNRLTWKFKTKKTDSGIRIWRII